MKTSLKIVNWVEYGTVLMANKQPLSIYSLSIASLTLVARMPFLTI